METVGAVTMTAIAIAAVLGAVVLVREIPSVVRYIRIKRM